VFRAADLPVAAPVSVEPPEVMAAPPSYCVILRANRDRNDKSTQSTRQPGRAGLCALCPARRRHNRSWVFAGPRTLGDSEKR
jgi:hypothetical protein